jgi:nitrite reductase/ring-hydroxylating ferredoxin subunit
MKHVLFPIDELERGHVRSVTVAGIRIAIIRTQADELWALRDICPHLGGQLSHGSLQPMVVGSEAGEYRLAETLILRCPWHGYEFDIQTGRCVADPEGLRVRSYSVTVEQRQVVLER